MPSEERRTERYEPTWPAQRGEEEDEDGEGGGGDEDEDEDEEEEDEDGDDEADLGVGGCLSLSFSLRSDHAVASCLTHSYVPLAVLLFFLFLPLAFKVSDRLSRRPKQFDERNSWMEWGSYEAEDDSGNGTGPLGESSAD